MEYKNIQVEIYDANFAIIRFTNAKKLCPLDVETASELKDTLENLREKEDIRALIITGSGKSFSAGGDIKGFLLSIEDEKPSNYMDDLTKHIYDTSVILRKYPKPIIAAVNGYAIGAGMNLALSCDLIIASEKAKFAQSFCKLGLIPGAGGTHLLINQIPWQKAAEYCFFGDMISPTELFNLGLVNLVVPSEELENIAIKMCERLVKGPTLAFARTKKLFLDALNSSFEDHIDNERKVQVEMAKTKDFEIGVRAINKREKPKFEGK
jgi:2-(1,2-epoxy-1,2-dihydrophenyl)acetyl-CoA isomerase